MAHPGAIEVAVENGKVTLSGSILADEVDKLLTCAKQIHGVNEVTNTLEVHKEAGNHPSLQGGRKRQDLQFEFLQENWSPAARLVAEPGGIGERRAKGKDSASQLSPSWITSLNERAAAMNNEI